MRARTLVCLLLLASLAAAAPAAAALAEDHVLLRAGTTRVRRARGLLRGERPGLARLPALRIGGVGRRPVRCERRDPAGLPPRRRAPRVACPGRRVRRVRPRDRAGAPARARPRRDDPAPVHQRPERALLADPAQRRAASPVRHGAARARGRRLLRALGPGVRDGGARRTRAGERGPLDRRLQEGAGDEGLRVRAGPPRVRARRRRHGRRRLGGAAERGRGRPAPRPGGVRTLLRAAAAARPAC